MCGNKVGDLFALMVWAMNKVKDFWAIVARQKLSDCVKQMHGYIIGLVSGKNHIRMTKSETYSTHNDSFSNFQGLPMSIR